jgi:hypothetical protein
MTANSCQEGSFMSVVYTLYDALVSINVPDEKAKAVIDAVEREMMDKLATKADLENLRLSNKADLVALRGEMGGEFKSIGSEFKLVRQEMVAMRDSLSKDIEATHERISNQTHVLTVRLFLGAAAMVPLILAAQKMF